MAKRKTNRTRVPVSNRSEKPKKRSFRPEGPVQRLDLIGVGVLVVVVLVILFAIAMPLRNYYQGRSEIARLNESIAAKQAEKDRLIDDINRYQDEDFIKEEARRRLGVIEAGETAFRIVDPRMNTGDSTTTAHSEVVDERPWHEVLWDSIATPPEDTGAEE